MKYVYVSPALPDKVFGELLGYGKNSPGQQAQKYNKLLAGGITLCGRSLTMLSAPPLPPGSRLFSHIKLSPENENGLEYRFLKVLDLPLIKNIYTYIQAKKETKILCGEGGAVLVCDLLTLSASLGALKAAKKAGAKTCGIVTDLPAYLTGAPSSKRYMKLYAKAISLCDCFVLLTKQMAEKIPIGDRPFTVIEGIATPPSLSSDEDLPGAPEGPFILYAGGIEKAYGVDKLVEGFLEANVPGATLVLCGRGGYSDELEKIAEQFSRVKYIGVVPNETVMKLEARASLLVNPRTSEGEFTAYSFPSKNIEYMSTGTPVLAYMLPGIPEEYREYFLVPENETAAGLGAAIKKALTLDPDELKAIGDKAKDFALEVKSPRASAAKLIEMTEGGTL